MDGTIGSFEHPSVLLTQSVTDARPAMDRRRVRFLAALVLFILWVAGLGVLAMYSSRRPAARQAPAAIMPRER